MVSRILKFLFVFIFLITGLSAVYFFILSKQIIGEEIILKKIILISVGLTIIFFISFMKRADKQILLILAVTTLFAPSMIFFGLKHLDSLVTYSQQKSYKCKINNTRVKSGRIRSTQIQLKDCKPKWPSQDNWINMNIFNKGTWINEIIDSASNLSVMVTTQPGITGFESITRVDLAIGAHPD